MCRSALRQIEEYICGVNIRGIVDVLMYQSIFILFSVPLFCDVSHLSM